MRFNHLGGLPASYAHPYKRYLWITLSCITHGPQTNICSFCIQQLGCWHMELRVARGGDPAGQKTLVTQKMKLDDPYPRRAAALGRYWKSLPRDEARRALALDDGEGRTVWWYKTGWELGRGTVAAPRFFFIYRVVSQRTFRCSVEGSDISASLADVG